MGEMRSTVTGVCCLQFMQVDSRRRMWWSRAPVFLFRPRGSSLHAARPSRATRSSLKLAVCGHTIAP